MLQSKLNTAYACWKQHTIRPLVLRMTQGTASIRSAWNLYMKCYCQHYTDLPYAIHKTSYLETMVILVSIIWGYRTSVNESSPPLTSCSSVFKPFRQQKLYATKISNEQMFNSVQVCLNFFVMKYNIVPIDQLKMYCKVEVKVKVILCCDQHKVGSKRYSSAKEQIQH